MGVIIKILQGVGYIHFVKAGRNYSEGVIIIYIRFGTEESGKTNQLYSYSNYNRHTLIFYVI